MIKRCVGYCPEMGKNVVVDVTFAKVQMCGTLTPGYKKMNYECQFSADCNTCGPDGRDCPIYKAANP
jgi:hypothetical protein